MPKAASKPAVRIVTLSNSDPISAETQGIQDRIRERAYELSQLHGHSGRHFDDWMKAESEIVFVPRAELVERDSTFELRFAVAGIPAGNIEVWASSQDVLVKGTQDESPGGPAIVHLSDFNSATVFRSISFPEPIEVESVTTQFKDGVLRITARKEGSAKHSPKRLSRKVSARKKQ